MLTLIRRGGPLSKARIARASELSAQTVSVIMRALEADGLLEKCDPVRGKVGQPQVPMRLAATGACFLGLKVGRRSLDLVLIDFTGTVLERLHHVHSYPSPDGVVRFANDGIARLLAGIAPGQRQRVAGLGIAVPFHLWDWARPFGVRDANMAAWRSRDIRAEIEDRWDFPVYMKNDATAACGAELVFGSTEGAADFLYFFVGFFVGGGLVVNRQVFAGRTGNAGALGSMPVILPNGTRGQLIDVASLVRLERVVLTHGGAPEAIWKSPEHWDLPAGALDEWIDGAAEGLAQAARAASTLIDFEEMVIDGWLPGTVRERLTREVAARLSANQVAGIALPRVREGTIGGDARALGAASLPLSHRFIIDQNNLIGS